MDTANHDNDFRAINILFVALVAGIVMFMAVSAMIVLTKGPLKPEADLKRMLFIILGVLATVCLLASFSNYNKKIEQIGMSGTAQQRLESYRGALIAFLALCELPALFAVISFLLTGDYLFLLSASIMLACMFSKRPTRDRVAEIVKL